MKHPISSRAVLAGALAVAVLAGGAQARGFKETVAPEVFRSQQRYNAEYVLQPGDQLEVAVFRVPEASKTSIVRPDGYISLPGLKDVQVAGLTVPQATAKITALEAQRLVDPDVTVSVLNPRDASIFVLGEVAKPGALPFRSAQTAAQALAQSGGAVRSGSWRGVAVLRLDAEGHMAATLIEPRHGGATGFYAAMAQVVLQPNDIIVVPESGRSQFVRFINDFITTPIGGVNQILLPYLQFRILDDVR